GDGSENNPFLIENADQLNEVRNHLDKHFKQMENIDLGGFAWEPIGINDVAGTRFSGKYDGNGKNITNLKVSRNHAGNNPENKGLGLFGAISGDVTNVHLKNVQVIGTNSKNVGGLVGINYTGTITNSTVSGK